MHKHFRCMFAMVLIAYLFLKTAPDVFAVKLTISDFPPSISDGAFSVSASVFGATDATNYLRVDLYKDGTDNYFGETYNGSDWYSGSEGKNYFPVQVQDSSASGTLQARLGSPSSTDYPGPGTYKLRVRRYTASGNAAGSDDQTPVDVQITYIFATPVADSMPTLHTTVIPSPTPVKTQTPVPSKAPTEKPAPTLVSETASEILGEATIGPTALPAVTPAGNVENKSKLPITAAIFILLGIAFIGGSCYLAFWKKDMTFPLGEK